MRCTLELFATLREKYRVKKLDVEFEGDLHDFFVSASRILGEEFLNDVYSNFEERIFRDDRLITVNGRNLKDIKGIPQLKDGDLIAVFPPVAGG
ncbi:Molybdopterin converting factor, small subunit [Archaeoglobus sulfaticallidus PM70-1]|uniref:Molybdopterin converting factor, small subunit n=1 Tax=Archaeoglobus sulfaticallidus PM70-1 TaxID=387631 RepID=N0BC17_9EURY|nr:MoaD/ThiS family protein [Archaeoglobus sulfaticallidus]AGK60518.1 Molybdopterin converting factor, small subunit [Archaeoglobus sulfaticallidus PM70-1]